MTNWFRRRSRTISPIAEIHASPAPFDTYETRAPSPQNCIDAIPGWNSAFPADSGLVGGDYAAFADDRIEWMIERFGPMSGAKVLELGPMEGAHTFMLHRAGASITAVEANKRAFLKCLVTKELFDLSRAKFLLGDCVEYLEQKETRYDLIVASGVLYHMRDPLRFLSAVAARTDALYVWTSFVDESQLDPDSDLAEALAGRREVRDFHGVPVTLYKMSYHGRDLKPSFCGGIYTAPLWMSRSSILESLRVLGFSSFEIAYEQRPMPHEPCFCVFARRGSAAR